MEAITITGQVRSDVGKKGTKAVRNAESIPCVLYGGDEVVHFSTTEKEVKGLIYTPDFKLAEIKVDGKSFRAILKDVQFHPVSGEILHIDFLNLVEGTPVKIELPVRFKGVSPGVKAGGKLLQKLRRVKVKTTPEHLVDELLLDVSSIELGQSIRVRDIKVDQHMEILSSPGIPVATVEIPRALRSATTAAEKAAGK